MLVLYIAKVRGMDLRSSTDEGRLRSYKDPRVELGSANTYLMVWASPATHLLGLWARGMDQDASISPTDLRSL